MPRLASKCSIGVGLLFYLWKGTPRPDNGIKQDTFLTPFSCLTANVSTEDERQKIGMFFSDEAQLTVNRFYNTIKSFFANCIVDSNYTTESMNITISDNKGAWFMNNYLYRIELFRNAMGNIDHIKVFAQQNNELSNLYATLSESHNFLGMRVSEVIRYNDHIWVKP